MGKKFHLIKNAVIYLFCGGRPSRPSGLAGRAMFLISSMIHCVKTELLRRQVRSLCRSHGLCISGPLGAGDLGIFREVFFSRGYSCCFPFYKKSVIIDIGAHKGFFSLFASLNAGEGSRIAALEPSSENFAALGRNISQNRAQVELHRLAVGGTTGTAGLFLSKNENFSLFETYAGINGPAGKKYGSETVDVVTFEELFKRLSLEAVDFLKLDCEGAEYPFLFGAPTRLLERVRTVSLEFHDLKRPDFSGLEAAAFLKRNGFDIVRFAYAPAVKNNNEGKLVATKY